MIPDEKDVFYNAKYLFGMNPAPWSILDDGFFGYVVDATGRYIFGGEPHEGRVSEDDPEIVALVDVINSLSVWMKTKGDL
jgi:hypothetical protein